MKAFALMLIIILLNIKHQIAAEELSYGYNSIDDDNQFQIQEPNQQAFDAAKQTWRTLQNGWSKRASNALTEYERQKLIPVDAYTNGIQKYDYDNIKQQQQQLTNDNNNRVDDDADDDKSMEKRAWKMFNFNDGKRFVNSWNNLQNAGWRKREPGNWNNLRGLWGKRSSSKWNRLQGSWGK
jgi:hypothetical protein